MSRPILAQPDGGALAGYLQIVRRAALPRVWSVVQANAYGHGASTVSGVRSAYRWFGLAELEEAILLRERGWHNRSCCWKGFFHAQDLPLAGISTA